MSDSTGKRWAVAFLVLGFLFPPLFVVSVIMFALANMKPMKVSGAYLEDYHFIRTMDDMKLKEELDSIEEKNRTWTNKPRDVYKSADTIFFTGKCTVEVFEDGTARIIAPYQEHSARDIGIEFINAGAAVDYVKAKAL